ncbi:MAG: hypothetical protein P5681_00830 [Limnospira sp. PMC 894.15]|nr:MULTISPECIES: hypothetical protein [unclassified Limnospira]MDT9186349.1 hypothetical protein [Limnospira sp. PMC 894.15]MDT9232284.1 hypothetical protein [Limnospira sp. PMC 917.15]
MITKRTVIIEQSKGSTTCRLAEIDLVVILPGVQLTDRAIA